MNGKFTQVKIYGKDLKLLNDIRIILKDSDTGEIPSYRVAITRCLQIVKDQAYQMNGSEVSTKPKTKKIKANF